MIFKTTIFLIFVMSLYACAENTDITKEEMKVQSKSDAIVAGVLFENDLAEKASYHIRKSGSVAIQFSEDVSNKDYTKVVNKLRAIPSITGVYAEQGGQEVCGIP